MLSFGLASYIIKLIQNFLWIGFSLCNFSRSKLEALVEIVSSYSIDELLNFTRFCLGGWQQAQFQESCKREVLHGLPFIATPSKVRDARGFRDRIFADCGIFCTVMVKLCKGVAVHN
jgi:hypothetical protein